MDTLKYSVSGSEAIDHFLYIMSGDVESEAGRFKFQIGDIVAVDHAHHENTNKAGDISEIRYRRNGYPPPLFHGFWFPLYYLQNLRGDSGGEIGESCLRLATDEERLLVDRLFSL